MYEHTWMNTPTTSGVGASSPKAKKKNNNKFWVSWKRHKERKKETNHWSKLGKKKQKEGNSYWGPSKYQV